MYQDDAQASAEDQASQRGNRRSTRRQWPVAADVTQSGDQVTSLKSKNPKIVANVATKRRGRKPETGSKGEVRYTDGGAFKYYDPNTKRWGMCLGALRLSS